MAIIYRSTAVNLFLSWVHSFADQSKECMHSVSKTFGIKVSISKISHGFGRPGGSRQPGLKTSAPV